MISLSWSGEKIWSNGCLIFILDFASTFSGLKGSDVSIVVILGIVAVRYIFLPLLGVVVVKAATHFGLVGSNLLFQFVLMLQYAVPPAMGTGMTTSS